MQLEYYLSLDASSHADAKVLTFWDRNREFEFAKESEGFGLQPSIFCLMPSAGTKAQLSGASTAMNRNKEVRVVIMTREQCLSVIGAYESRLFKCESFLCAFEKITRWVLSGFQ